MSGYTEVGTQEAPASQMDETVEALYLQISNLDDESELADFEDGMQNIEELFQIVSSETHVDLEKRQRFQHEIEFLQTIVGDPRQVDVWIEMIKELNEELSNYLMRLLHSNNGQSNPRTESTTENHVSVRFPTGHERESIPHDAEDEEKIMRRGMAQVTEEGAREEKADQTPLEYIEENTENKDVQLTMFVICMYTDLPDWENFSQYYDNDLDKFNLARFIVEAGKFGFDSQGLKEKPEFARLDELIDRFRDQYEADKDNPYHEDTLEIEYNKVRDATLRALFRSRESAWNPTNDVRLQMQLYMTADWFGSERVQTIFSYLLNRFAKILYTDAEDETGTRSGRRARNAERIIKRFYSQQGPTKPKPYAHTGPVKTPHGFYNWVETQIEPLQNAVANGTTHIWMMSTFFPKVKALEMKPSNLIGVAGRGHQGLWLKGSGGLKVKNKIHDLYGSTKKAAFIKFESDIQELLKTIQGSDEAFENWLKPESDEDEEEEDRRADSEREFLDDVWNASESVPGSPWVPNVPAEPNIPDEKAEEPGPGVPPQVPPAVPEGVREAARVREEQTWDAWEQKTENDSRAAPNDRELQRVFDMIKQNRHKLFYKYVDGDVAIHPRLQTHLINRNFRDAKGTVEMHRIRKDPLEDTVDKRLHKLSARNDPLHTTAGRAGTLGRYILIKVNPSAIHICIKKRVQERALYLLAERIIEHSRAGPTRIVLKRSDRGRFTYNEWISTNALAKIDAQTLYDRLLKQTRNRTKYINLIVKQQRVGGSIHDRVNESRSLL